LKEQTKPEIGLRPVTEVDTSFLEKVYAATRIDEFSMMGWPPEQLEAFLRCNSIFKTGLTGHSSECRVLLDHLRQ